MNFLLFLLLSVSTAHGFDYVVDTFKKYVDHFITPCENFYRHACKFGSPNDVMYSVYSSFYKKILDENPKSWDDLSILEGIECSWNNETIARNITHLYLELCKNGDDTVLFLTHLDKILGHDPDACDGRSCYEYVLDDPNCERGAKHVKALIDYQFPASGALELKMNQFRENVQEILKLINYISLYFDVDVREGIELSRKFLDEMKEILGGWMKDTPWLLNNNVTDSANTLLWPSTIEYNYGKVFQDSIDILIKMERNYRNCREAYNNVEESKIFCLVHTKVTHLSKFEKIDGFSLNEAFNKYPKMSLGYAYFHVAQYAEEMAAKLGFTGFTVGHELSHTLIKDSPGDFMTYFSPNARECIQDQFNSTCAYFHEEECVIKDSQFDDNGADILGLQLSYKSLENYYGQELNDIYEPLGVTHHQLFYYSLALSFCEGQVGGAEGDQYHAPSYVRVNAMISQHPGFKEAFQCSDNSSMMKSAVKQCIVYGEGAPEMRKH